MTDSENLDLSRRRLLGTVGAAGAAGLVVGAAGGAGISAALSGDDTAGTGAGGAPALTTVGSTAVMFHGKHQAGITTPSSPAAI